jgi:bilirubin oxidase
MPWIMFVVLGAAAPAPAAAPFLSPTAGGELGDTLRAPAALVNESDTPGVVEVTITAADARLELVPGVETDAWAFNGQVPGPLLEAYEGDSVIVHFRNDLSEPTTIHWHGIHLPFRSDGSPFDPVEPGETVDYVFRIHEGTAGTYWYHPHPDARTQYQMAKGLFGSFVVRSREDPLPPMTERLIVLYDNRFGPDGSVDLPESHTMQGRIDFENGREGDVLFVNGQVMPTIPIRAGEVQRWRVINASAARVYKLAIPGHTFLHVGSDGGLFEQPIETDEIVIANTERVELLVRGTGAPGERTVLEDRPYNRYIPQTRPASWDSTKVLLAVQYTDDAPLEPIELPATLIPIAWLDTTDVAATQVFSLSQGMINGKTMDMSRVDATAQLGTTEIWEIENLVGMDHPFHLHGFRFQVIERDGVPEPYPSWKDTVNVPKHQTVRFVVRFENYAGKWMYHCHILTHEDFGMMGVLEVK